MLTITKQYLDLINDNKLDLAEDLVRAMTNDQKIVVRRELESINEGRILRTLTYDYENQQWLFSEDEIQKIMQKHDSK